VPVAPVAGNEKLSAALERIGARHYNNWMRLHRELTNLPRAIPSSIDVREIGPSEGAAFGAIVAAGFGYPPAIAPIAQQVVGRPHWRHYLAFENGAPIAAAAMYVSGEAAWFGFAATAEAWRGQGAQSALICRRLADAAADGCTSVSVETSEDVIEKNAPSFRNLRRLGFEVAYRRPNYLWTRGGHAGT
jgi:GNAT superfamily N-acetyltransferase